MADRRAKLTSLIVALLFAFAPMAARAAAALPVDARTFGVVCDAVADDTAHINLALATGLPLQLPIGVCKTTGSLLFTSAAQAGQWLNGAGETDASGAGAATTTIRPTSAVTQAFKIDGLPFGSYMTGIKISNLTLDMVNMPAGSKGFLHGQSYDNNYEHVRVRNDTAKAAWSFGPGAFVATLNTVQGFVVECIGNGTQNPTTISLISPDILGLNAAQCASVTTMGGAIQFSFVPGVTTVQWIASGNTNLNGFYSTVAAFNTANGTSGGVYVALGSYFDNMQFLKSDGTDWEVLAAPPNACSLGAGTYTFGTYNDGTHGCHPVIWALSVSATVNGCELDLPVLAGLYLYQPGGGRCNLHGFVPNTNIPQSIDYTLHLFAAKMALVNSQAFYCYSDLGMTVQTCLIDASNGLFSFAGGQFKPLTDGTNFFNVFNAAGTQIGGMFSSATAANSVMFFNNFQASDGTHAASLSGATGVVQGNSVKAQPVTNSANDVFLIIDPTNLVQVENCGTAAAAPIGDAGCKFANGANLKFYSDGFITLKASINGSTGQIYGTTLLTNTTTVAGLPSAATAGVGALAYVTDATACTFGSTPTGGGAVKCPVYSDGAAWKAG